MNGLQVEDAPRFAIVSGSASLAFIDAAIAAGADALLVHHGLFWRGHDGRLTGWLRQARRRNCSPTTSTCLPTTCRWTRTPNSATTRSSGRRIVADGRCTVRRAGPRLHRRSRRSCSPDRGSPGGAVPDPRRAHPRCRATGGRCARIRRGHRRRAGLLRGRHRRRRGCLRHGRNLRATVAHYARETGVAFPRRRPLRERSASALRRWRPVARSLASSIGSSTSTTRHEGHRRHGRVRRGDTMGRGGNAAPARRWAIAACSAAIIGAPSSAGAGCSGRRWSVIERPAGGPRWPWPKCLPLDA